MIFSVKFRQKIKDFVFPLNLFNFFKWKIIDIYRIFKYGRSFSEYGVDIYCGRQGYGKTIAIVEYLERMRKKYPNVLIVTNMYYINEHFHMEDWRDLLKYRNGLDGVIFVIDEIQNEFSSQKWADFPEYILSEITQQRKQKIKIVLSAQSYKDVVVQLRRQCFNVIECRTLASRWTFTRTFDSYDYEYYLENLDPDKRRKIPRKCRYSFVQSDVLRNLYDSYKKVESMKKKSYITKV